MESHAIAAANGSRANGSAVIEHRTKAIPVRARKGSKRGFVLGRIGESIGGATTAELWNHVQRTFPDMKRSSLRALLYLEAKSGNIDRRGERYVLKQDRPSAPTLSLPH
jgi:hypothetical protein